MGRFLLCVCGAGALAAVAPTTASARPSTLPGSWYNLELPYNWSLADVNADSADFLKFSGDGGGGVHIYAFTSCADMQTKFAALHTSGTYAYGSDFLPYGWTGTQNSAGDDHVMCYEKDSSHAIGVRDVNKGEGTWKDQLLTLLSYVQSGWFSTNSSDLDNVAWFPGTGLTFGVPNSKVTWTDSDSSASKDVLTYTNTSSVTYAIYRRYDSCGSAVSSISPSATSASTYTAASWTDYNVAGSNERVHCYSGNGTVVVVAPTEAAMVAAGGSASDIAGQLLAISNELTTPTALGAVSTLPNSQWKVAMPNGWVASVYDPSYYTDLWDDEEYEADWTKTYPSEAAKQAAVAAREDMIAPTGAYQGIVVARPADSCDTVLASGDKFDPGWLPDGWRATGNSWSDRVYCKSVDGATVKVVVHAGAYLARNFVVTVLESLSYQNTPTPTYDTTTTSTYPTLPSDPPAEPTPYAYSPPKKAILPFPLELSLQTLSTDLLESRGWGARLGAHLEKPLGERLGVGIGGEVAYDTEAGLGYDLGAYLDLRLTRGLGAQGIVGYDQIGMNDTIQKGGAVYYGVGGSWGTHADKGGLSIEAAYLWRSVPDDALVMDPIFPDHEWRFGADLFFQGDRITGLSAEYRTAKDIKTILLGLRLRL